MEKDPKISKVSLLTEMSTLKKYESSSSLYPNLSDKDSHQLSANYVKMNDDIGHYTDDIDEKKRLNLFTNKFSSNSSVNQSRELSDLNNSNSSQNLTRSQSITMAQNNQQIELIREQCYHCNNKLMIPMQAKFFKCFYCKMVCDRQNKPSSIKNQIFICGNCHRKVSYLPITNYVKCLCNAVNFVPNVQQNQMTQSMQIQSQFINSSLNLNRSQSMSQSSNFFSRPNEISSNLNHQERSNSLAFNPNLQVESGRNALYPNLNPTFNASKSNLIEKNAMNQNQNQNQRKNITTSSLGCRDQSKPLSVKNNSSKMNNEYGSKIEKLNDSENQSEKNKEDIDFIEFDTTIEDEDEQKIPSNQNSLAQSEYIPIKNVPNERVLNNFNQNPFQPFSATQNNLAESQYIESYNQISYTKTNNPQNTFIQDKNLNEKNTNLIARGLYGEKLYSQAEKLDDD